MLEANFFRFPHVIVLSPTDIPKTSFIFHSRKTPIRLPLRTFTSMAGKPYLIVVGGPTASGKTSFAIWLAIFFDTVILSCDSRQFYREMRIGTARPTPEEMARVPHHFIGHLSISQSYSVGDYERDALSLLDQLFRQHEVVILTGGSGLYQKALCEGLDPFPAVPTQVKAALEKQFSDRGIAFLQEELRRVDPAYYQEVDIHNPARLIRALAVYRASGQPFSAFRKQQPAERPFRPVYLQLHHPREVLYARIDQRVDEMIREGLEAEARALSPFREQTALQTVGYQEFFDYFDGKQSLAETIELIKRNTRRYAKRQLTWMRRDPCWKHFRPEEKEECLRYLSMVMGAETCFRMAAGDDRQTAREWIKSAFPGFPLPENAELLCLYGPDRPLGAAALLTAGKNRLLSPVAWSGPDKETAIHREVLLHEAVRLAGDDTLYAWCLPAHIPQYRAFGFTGSMSDEPAPSAPASWISIPPSLRLMHLAKSPDAYHTVPA